MRPRTRSLTGSDVHRKETRAQAGNVSRGTSGSEAKRNHRGSIQTSGATSIAPTGNKFTSGPSSACQLRSGSECTQTAAASAGDSSPAAVTCLAGGVAKVAHCAKIPAGRVTSCSTNVTRPREHTSSNAHCKRARRHKSTASTVLALPSCPQCTAAKRASLRQVDMAPVEHIYILRQGHYKQ